MLDNFSSSGRGSGYSIRGVRTTASHNNLGDLLAGLQQRPEAEEQQRKGLPPPGENEKKK